MKRRRLADLYRKGREVTFDDGSGEPVVVWLQKINPVDHETVLRKANAARARLLMYRNDRDSEEWQAAYNEALDFGTRDMLVEYLIQPELAKRERGVEAELAEEEEWSKDDFIQGLHDAWNDGDNALKYRYAEDPEDPEAKRVFAELKKFADIVNTQLEGIAEQLRRDYEGVDEEELRQTFSNQFLEAKANSVWLTEYRRSQLFLATRYPEDHGRFYFESRDEIDSLEDEVFIPLVNAYESLIVDVTEGKGSQPTPASSPSSEQPGELATVPSSGPPAATP